MCWWGTIPKDWYYSLSSKSLQNVEPDVGFHPSVSHFYFVQLLSAVSYLHSRGICHRDIKPENLLLDERGNLKLADFGLSTLFKKGNTRRTLQTRCGTSLYMAPEVIDGAYEGDQADLWSCAVVLFVMLTGSHPWEEPSMKCSLYRRFSLMSHHDYPPWDQFEPECSNLLDRMLKADRRQRLSMEQIKRHRWTLERNPLLDQNGQCLDPKALAHLLRLDIPIDSPFPLTQPAAPSIRHSQVTASKYSSFLAFSQPSADIIKLNDDELGENSFCSTLTRFYCQIDPFAASSKLICILDTFLISWKNQPSPHHVQNLLLV